MKNTATILEKLKREKTRLSRIQDIAGFRVVSTGSDRGEQDRLVATICDGGFLTDLDLQDRRSKPKHGYRAVHVIGKAEDCWVEIQVRTSLQHRWAQVFEYLADHWGRGIRYGDSPEDPLGRITVAGATTTKREVLEYMKQLSEHIAEAEQSYAALAARNGAISVAADDLHTHEVQAGRRDVLHELLHVEKQLEDAEQSLTALRQVLEDNNTQEFSQNGPETHKRAAHGYRLVIYDRSTRKVRDQYLGTPDKLMAMWRNLDLEYRNEPHTEVVLLATESLKSARTTHGRYFESAPDLAGESRPDRTIGELLAQLPPREDWANVMLEQFQRGRSASLEVARRIAAKGPNWSVDVGTAMMLITEGEAYALRRWFRDEGIDFEDLLE
ncbi:hypothetical protein ACFL6C_10605 [Myxococcota bacterium]